MWKLTKIADEKVSCDNYEMGSADITAVIEKLEKKFNVQYANKSAVTMDMTALDFYVDSKEIVIGWDCWSGVFIMSKSKSENDIIEKIYEYLSKQ